MHPARSSLSTYALAAVASFALNLAAANTPMAQSGLKDLLGEAQKAQQKQVEDLIGKLEAKPRSTAAEPPPTPPPATIATQPAPAQPTAPATAATETPTSSAPPATAATTPPPAAQQPPAATAATPPPQAPAALPAPKAAEAKPELPVSPPTAAAGPSMSPGGVTPPATAAAPEPKLEPKPRPELASPRPAPSAPAATPAPSDKAAAQDAVAEAALPSVDLDVYFDFNSAAITPKAAETLEPLGKAMKDPRLARAIFLIAGHTDAKGNPTVNQQMSVARAEAVRQYLTTKFGISPTRMVARGFGQARLKDRDNPLAEANRRVQIVNVTEFARK